MERWDAYDENFKIVEGITLIRGKRIPDGLFHLVSDVIVRHTDGDYLLMQRSDNKHYGGLWEATAGGSALEGEDALACALRELEEETGIQSGELTELGMVVNHKSHTIFVEFLCITNRPKDKIILQEGETSAYQWVSKDKLKAMKPTELVTRRIQKFIDELRP